MKKIFLSAAMLAMIAVGCTNEEIVKMEQSQMISIEASYGADSRTTINGTNTVWQPGDQIYVSSADGKCFGTLTLEGNGDGSNGKFIGFVSGDPADLAYSVFPVPTDGVIDLTKRSANSPDAPMIATFGINKNALSFDLTCGMVAVKINGAEGKSVTLTYDNTFGLGGTAVVAYNETTKKYELEYTRTSTTENGVTITDIPSSEALVYIPVITSDGEGNELPTTGNINLNVTIGNASTVINVPVAEGKVSLEQVPEITYDAEKDEIKKEGTVIPDAQKSSEEALREAMASDDKVITLSTDVELTSPLVVTKAKVLDLAGFKITNNAETFDTTEEALVIVNRNASLTINDSQNSGEIVVTNNNGIYSAIKMTASTEENNGPEAVLVVNGGHISGTYYGISGNGKRNGTSVIINGGKIQCTGEGSGIFQPQEGTLEINGGEIIGQESAVEVRAGRMVMNGGTLKCETEFKEPEANKSGTTMRGGVALGIARHTTGNDIEIKINGGELVVPANSEGKTYYGIYEYSQEGTTGRVEMHLKDYSKSLKAESAALYCEVSSSENLQKAVDFVAPKIIVNLSKDIEGTIVVTEKKNVHLEINGFEHKYDGQIKIWGNSSKPEDCSLLIKDVNFETSTAGLDFIWSADSQNGSYWRYAENVTVEGCTFTALGDAVHTAVGARFQQAYSIKLVGCIANNMHSLLQAESCGTKVSVEDCTVNNGKNGVSFNNTMDANISGTTIESVVKGGYGIRHKGQVDNYKLTVTNCDVEAFVPVLIRNMTAQNGYTATFSGENTLTETNPDYDYQIVISNGDYDGTENPVKPTGNYTLIGAEGFKVFGK